MHKQFGCQRIIAVEPDAENAELARENFALNRIPAQLIQAAVGPKNALVRFARNRSSNLGKIVDASHATVANGQVVDVPMVTMDCVLKDLANDEYVDVLKVDIEGAEKELFTEGSRAWLRRVRGIVAEFHPTSVNYDSLVRALYQLGFDHIAPHSVFPGNMTAFVRRN
jgi:FkbM family methyltransferase